MKDLFKNENFLKLFFPISFLGFFILGPFIIFGFYELFGINLSAFQFILFFLPQYLFPYDGYFRSGPFDENAQKCLHPLCLPGWTTSLIHWVIVLLIYYWITKKLNLKKSLLMFCFLSISSLILVNFILGLCGWEFGGLDGP